MRASTVTEPPSQDSLLKRTWDLHGEKVRFLVVGGLNTALGYGLFLILLWLLATPIKALEVSRIYPVHWLGEQYYLVIGWIGWFISVPISTATMKYFAFKNSGSFLKQWFRAYFIYLPSQGIGTLVLWFMVRVVGLIPAIGSLATIFVTTIFSYVGHKYFTFKSPIEVGEVVPQDLLEGE